MKEYFTYLDGALTATQVTLMTSTEKLCFRVIIVLLGPWIVMPATADISVVVGPTAIPRGDARAKKDITINNGRFAVAFAVESAPPWGVARGGIVDIAIVRDGIPGNDFVSLVDFMPNNWSSWPTTYQRVSLVKKTKHEVVVRTLRDWGSAALESVFRINDDSDTIHVVTQMTNNSEKGLTGLLSGYVAWPDGGFVFGVPGLTGIEEGLEAAALAEWSATYDEDWALGLHAPFADYQRYNGRDRYLVNDLQPGQTRTFEAWIQIVPRGDLAPIISKEIALQNLDHGIIHGEVKTTAGGIVTSPALVVYRNGRLFGWTVGGAGQYDMQLPTGTYSIYTTGAGFSQSQKVNIEVSSAEIREQDFDTLEPPGRISMNVVDAASGEQLDARISIDKGQESEIEYLGKNTFFTELNEIGTATLSIAPGEYSFRISSGDGFTAGPTLVQTRIKSGEENHLQAALTVESNPSVEGWYGADMHHHSDVLDGLSPPTYVIRSQLAAGLDVAFLSDHDSVINNSRMRELAASRGVPFVPATELSASWGHFNAYPVNDGEPIQIDTGKATVREVFSEARRLGAKLLSVNHPYLGYGYFANSEQSESVPGGYDNHFDLVEISATAGIDGNQRTAERTWQLWNEGHRAYFVAGSDAHDVWEDVSGSARSYVHVSGKITMRKFIDALRNGHSYATQGPLIFPDRIFGSDAELKACSSLTLSYILHAVSGLRSVHLIERSVTIQQIDFDDVKSSKAEFTVQPASDTWYSVVVTDANDKRAYSNPIWVHVADGIN